MPSSTPVHVRRAPTAGQGSWSEPADGRWATGLFILRLAFLLSFLFSSLLHRHRWAISHSSPPSTSNSRVHSFTRVLLLSQSFL